MHSVKNRRISDERLKSFAPYLRNFLAEFLGTAILLLIGCMGCVAGFNYYDVHHLSALTFGLAVMISVQIFAHLSGAHLNPAVTIAAFVLRYINWKMGLVYIVAQFIGAIVGFVLLRALVTSKHAPDGFCVTTVNETISIVQAFFIEFIITLILVWVCCAVWDVRNAAHFDSVAIRFGLVIACLAMVAGPFTGASMNTARSLAPLIYCKTWKNQWIYLVAPNLAAVIGAVLYYFIFHARRMMSRSNEMEMMA